MMHCNTFLLIVGINADNFYEFSLHKKLLVTVVRKSLKVYGTANCCTYFNDQLSVVYDSFNYSINFSCLAFIVLKILILFVTISILYFKLPFL